MQLKGFKRCFHQINYTVIVHIPQIQRVLWEQADTPNQNVEVICCLEVHLDLCNNKLITNYR